MNDYRPPEGQIDVLVVGPTRVHVDRARVDNPDDFNHLVGDGSISMLILPPRLRERGFYAYCDDDAIARHQPLNRWRIHLGHHVLRGPIVIFKMEGMGSESGLAPSEVRALVTYFAAPPSVAAQELAEQDRAFWEAHPSGMAIQELDSIDDLIPPGDPS